MGQIGRFELNCETDWNICIDQMTLNGRCDQNTASYLDLLQHYLLKHSVLSFLTSPAAHLNLLSLG